MTHNAEDLARKAAGIRLVLFDVDGVLTDGRILLHADGSESKAFSIRDGTGIVWAQRAGLATGLLSARQSGATTARAAQLGIRLVRQEARDKLQMYSELLEEEGLNDVDVAFMGDDVLDLPVLSRVGLSAAPADAAPDVLARVDWVSSRVGGDGAARELIELLLHAQGKWETLIDGYVRQESR